MNKWFKLTVLSLLCIMLLLYIRISYLGLNRNCQNASRNFKENVSVSKNATTLKLEYSEGSPIYKNSAGRQVPFFLTACTMVRNEVPYIVEWIEFMSLQGVDRFIIYDDKSTDNVTLLMKLYQQVPQRHKVHILQSVDFSNEYYQIPTFNHCFDAYGSTTVWMIISDVDEFLYSPNYYTLKQMLLNGLPAVEKERNNTVNHILTDCTRWGTGGQKKRFQYYLEEDANGRVTYKNGCAMQLILNHTVRGPDPRFENEKELYHKMHASVEGCLDKTGWDVCDNGPGKSMYRPEFVLRVDVHSPKAMLEGGIAISIKELSWCAHYYIKSEEDSVLKGKHRGEMAERMYKTSDAQFWSHIADTTLQNRFQSILEHRMNIITTWTGKCELDIYHSS